ncbi:expressed unknown protein [Seminavis robusta]|uniref:Uncharacterized protein n=1 Tax=Seminavis robusta TaxID=568900 RepID=A0A9N8HLX8_9STRA|nr:expressed unknown protein [Seminavis robusta]|eukprot:Sro1066_g237340.1 n/a (471) ;mRNA; f:32294-33706
MIYLFSQNPNHKQRKHKHKQRNEQYHKQKMNAISSFSRLAVVATALVHTFKISFVTAQVTSGPFLPQEQELTKNKSLWLSNGPQFYKYDYTVLSGNSPPEADGHPYPWTIVRANGSFDGYDAQNNQITGHISLPTIGQFFDLIQDQIALGTAHSIVVTYNTQYGYPMDINIVMADNTDYHVLNTVLVSLPGTRHNRNLVVAAQFMPQYEQWQKAKALWTSNGPQFYKYDYTVLSGNSPPEADGHPYPWTIVRDNGSFDGYDAQNNQITGHISLPTIGQFFDLIEDQLGLSTAHSIEVTYNTQYGYPMEIHIIMADNTDYHVLNTVLVSLPGTGHNRNLEVAPQFMPQYELWEKAKAQWTAQGPQFYQYDYVVVDGASPPAAVGHPYPWTILRDNGYFAGYDDKDQQITGYISLPTIGQFFDKIEDQLGLSTAHDIDVTYDVEYGYPTDIYIVMADQSVYHVVNSKLTKLG